MTSIILGEEFYNIHYGLDSIQGENYLSIGLYLKDITKYPYLLFILNQLMFQLTFIESY